MYNILVAFGLSGVGMFWSSCSGGRAGGWVGGRAGGWTDGRAAGDPKVSSHHISSHLIMSHQISSTFLSNLIKNPNTSTQIL